MHRYRGGTVLRTAGALPAALVIAALAAAVPVTAQTTSLKTVRDPQNRFSIAVPAAWDVTTQTKNPAVAAKSPSPQAMLPDSLEVTVYDWILPISARDCISKSDMILRYLIHTWTTVAEGSVTIAGEAGYSRVYDWETRTGEPRESVEVCVTQRNRVYVTVGTTENTSAKVSATMPLLQDAIATLRPNLANLPSETASSQPGR